MRTLLLTLVVVLVGWAAARAQPGYKTMDPENYSKEQATTVDGYLKILRDSEDATAAIAKLKDGLAPDLAKAIAITSKPSNKTRRLSALTKSAIGHRRK